jgi:hypothetical protein
MPDPMSELRNQTRQLAQHLTERCDMLRAQGLEPDSHHHPLSVAEGADLAKALDQVLACLAWHHHTTYDHIRNNPRTSIAQINDNLDLS